MSWLRPGRARARKARAELMANAEKALRMKREGEVDPKIPPHQTAHDGMRPGSGHGTAGGNPEADFTSQMKRSRVARSGEAS
jgi:hypothetical protein